MKEDRFLNIIIKFFSILILLWAITVIFNFLFAIALANRTDISYLLPHIVLVSIPVIISVTTAYLVLKGSKYAPRFSLYLVICYLLFAGASIIFKADLKFQERYEIITLTRYENLPQTKDGGKLNPEKFLEDRLDRFRKRRVQGFLFMTLFFSFFAMTLNKRIFYSSHKPHGDEKIDGENTNSEIIED